jgi:hypothetical protein
MSEPKPIELLVELQAVAGRLGVLASPNGHDSDVFTAQQLQAMEFPPLRWAIPGILPQGAALLCGPPKIGKSRLALQLACAVAYGGVALSHTEVARGGVLILALEDSKRRIRERLAALLEGTREPWPAGLTFATEWPRLDEGGAERLDAYLTEHGDTRLVIIDVLQMIRPHLSGRENPYAADYAAGRIIKQLADRHDITIPVVHHTRKLAANDPVDLVSGTNGLAGAVDSILVLQHEPNGSDATLYLRGRDVEEAQFTLAYDRERGAWNIAGEARAVPLSETREKIIAALERAWPATLSPKETAEATGLAEIVVRKRLGNLDQAGMIQRVGYGRYALAVPPSHSSQPSQLAMNRDECDECDGPVHSGVALAARGG